MRMSPRTPAFGNVRFEHVSVATHPPAERRRMGVARRREVPRSAQSEWATPSDRADPVEILIAQGRSRIPGFCPIRFSRMRADPFAFLRGGAAIMAADLASTP